MWTPGSSLRALWKAGTFRGDGIVKVFISQLHGGCVGGRVETDLTEPARYVMNPEDDNKLTAHDHASKGLLPTRCLTASVLERDTRWFDTRGSFDLPLMSHVARRSRCRYGLRPSVRNVRDVVPGFQTTSTTPRCLVEWCLTLCHPRGLVGSRIAQTKQPATITRGLHGIHQPGIP